MGRFLNADVFVSTGQGFTGNNMFAYCNNNPVNYADSSGQWSVTATKCVINVVTSIVCDIVSHASIGEIVVNATLAAVGTVIEPIASLVTIVNALETTATVAQATGDLGFGLFMGCLVIGTSFCTGETIGNIPGVENLDDAAELFLDATVGLAANVICAKGTYDYTDGYVSEPTPSRLTRTAHNNSAARTNHSATAYTLV